MYLVYLGLLVACAQCYVNDHYGDVAFRVKVHSASEWKTVEAILHKHMETEDVDIWKFPDKHGNAYFLVLHDAIDVVTRDLDYHGITHETTIDDVGSLLNSAELVRRERSEVHKSSVVGTYARYDDILAWFDELSVSYPELVSTVDIGTTFEGRTQRIMKLSTGGTGKWNVYVEGGMHAREWVSPSTVIYIADQIIQGYANGTAEILQWFDLVDWYFLPVANPDGYEYTHTTERLWRKNRNPNDGSSCIGTDLNRNWGYEWGGVGADVDPCSNTYRGPFAESEAEVQNIVNFILPQADTFILSMAYHSWGQQFFTRWDYTNDTVPPDHDELLDVAQRAVDAIVAVHGLFYEAGTAPNLMYTFSGSSADWARGTANIKYPFLEELRDLGNYAFELPEEQIIPTGQENWAGFQVVIREIADKCTGIPPPGPCNP